MPSLSNHHGSALAPFFHEDFLAGIIVGGNGPWWAWLLAGKVKKIPRKSREQTVLAPHKAILSLNSVILYDLLKMYLALVQPNCSNT